MAIIAVSGKIDSGKDTIGKIIRWLEYSTDINIISMNLHPKAIGVYTFKDFINNRVQPNKINTWEIKKFADPLKDIVCILLNCTREQLEDEEFKNKELGEEWWYYGIFNIYEEFLPYGESKLIKIYDTKEEANQHIVNLEQKISYMEEFRPRDILRVQLIKLTPRKLMQLLGTECGRNIIHPNIWINTLMSQYIPYKSYPNKEKYEHTMFDPNWIITDLRFLNELKAVKDRNGIAIRVNRDTKINTPKGVRWLNYDDWVFESTGKKPHISETELDNAKFDHVINNDSTLEELVEKVKEILIKENII